MKRKITYLLKDFDAMMKKILTHSISLEQQVNFMKNKQEAVDEIDKMIKKYDKIIASIKENSEQENEAET